MANPSGDVPFAIDGETISSVERASSSIGGLGLETVLLLTFLAVVVVGVLGILTYLYSARDVLENEIEEVEAEEAAFLAFAERIEGMPVERTATAMATPQSIQTFESGGLPAEKVTTAFEETVMALPHYEKTYGDDVLAQMGTELDADLIASLHHQGTLSPAMKRGLHQRAREAADKRTDLLEVLETERATLDESESTLTDVVGQLQRMNERRLSDHSYDSLIGSYDRLRSLQSDVEELVERRQESIQGTTRTLLWSGEDVTLQEYLYGDTAHTYPVLYTAARIDRLITRAQSRVRRALWSRA